jgi:hypothetical protein
VALALEAVGDAPRSALAARLLRARDADILDHDHSAEEQEAVIWTAKRQIRDVASAAIAAHPKWIEKFADLRGVLHARAVRGDQATLDLLGDDPIPPAFATCSPITPSAARGTRGARSCARGSRRVTRRTGPAISRRRR